jgi:hypothetical protein
MDGGNEERSAGARKVLIVAKQNSQMAVSATAARGINSPLIADQLALERLQRVVGRFAINRREAFVGELNFVEEDMPTTSVE